MTAQERAARWRALVDAIQRMDRWGGVGVNMTITHHKLHHARLALDAYEALKEADTLETLDEMGYDAECVIRQQWEAKRCGTCRWACEPLAIESNYIGKWWQCGNSKSQCSTDAGNVWWSSDHGCPHHERKDGAE